jgi:endonuclease/exonuclease/phosphatase (EEP) superfamily protein YafD
MINRHSNIVRVLFQASIVFILVSPTLSWVGVDFYPQTLFVHWAHWLSVASIIVAIAATWTKMKRFAAVALISGLTNLAGPMALFMPAAEPELDGQLSIRVLHANLYLRQQDPKAVEEMIFAANPDVIFLHELTPGIWERLALVRQNWRFQAAVPRGDYYGVGVLSRLPLSDMLFLTMEPGSLPVAMISLGQLPVPHAIISPHLFTPTSPDQFRLQQQQFDWLAAAVSQLPQSRVVIGDFNSTPWHPTFRSFLARSNLRDARWGKGFFATWPQILGNWGIPIDLAASSGALVVKQLQTVPIKESDHLGVMAVIGQLAQVNERLE